jgi:hypothetical protein
LTSDSKKVRNCRKSFIGAEIMHIRRLSKTGFGIEVAFSLVEVRE